MVTIIRKRSSWSQRKLKGICRKYRNNTLVAQGMKGTFRFVIGKITRHNPENLKVKLAAGTLGPAEPTLKSRSRLMVLDT
jgi:hypothetical protein